MDNTRNYFEAKYCACCFEPLDDDFNGVCSACGQKTTAININKRLKSDSAVGEKYGNAPKKAAAVFGAAAVIQLVYSIIVLLIITGAMKAPAAPAETVPTDSAYSQTENDFAFYLNRALECDTYREFIQGCSLSAHKEDFYKRIWSMSIEVRLHRENAHELPQDPVPPEETESGGKSVLPVIGDTAAIVILSVSILTALILILHCIAALRGKDGSMSGLAAWGRMSGEASATTLNIITVVLCVFGLRYLDKVSIGLGGNSLRAYRVHKAKNPLGDTDEWCGKYCGCINSKRDGECRSCGKYR